MTAEPTVDFVFDVGGVYFTLSADADDAQKIMAWSTSEVILYLGSEGPKFQQALRQVFGS